MLPRKMEEKTLQLAQTLARQSLLDEEAAERAEAMDGSPQPLRKNKNNVTERLQGFR